MNAKLQGISSVGVTVFVACAIAGGVGSALWNRPWPALAGGLVGIYFFFAIKVAPQWEKVALLRFGRYVGLRGPGIFTIIPVVDTLSRYVDQRVRVTKGDRGNRADPRHGARERRRHCLLGGLECREVDPGGGEFHRRHHHERPDGPARIHWPPRAGADDHGARNPGP